MTWFRTMKERYMSFPDNYIVIDTETTGLRFGEDLAAQIGVCLVSGRNMVANESTVLDWTRCRNVDQDWLRWRMNKTRDDMAAKGKVCRMTYERLQKEGQDPVVVLKKYASILEEARAHGHSYVGHNIWGFDIPILQPIFDRHGPPFSFGSENIIDTGIMEKASQLKAFPRPGETLSAFYTRIKKQVAEGVYWALSDRCIPKYRLDVAYKLDMAKAHDAGFDCYITHLLFEKYRELALMLESPYDSHVCPQVKYGSKPLTTHA